MRCTSLASGSKGNCLLVEGDTTALLVDAGLTRREILARLHAAGKSAEGISGILVTHEHVDHVAAVMPLAREFGRRAPHTRATHPAL
ncbi:MAG: MBL fold metallo-hydrolase, partial [Methanolinea sp.]